ncbi:hypothetical protein CB1_000569013 [Camelus ferus]|nr:hypothetical protein CB1_000569013 [Camelus ferus]
MALNYASLSAGDRRSGRRSRVFRRSSLGDLSSSALALAMVSGDSFLVTRPQAVLPELIPRPAVRLNVRGESRRAPGGGRSLTQAHYD